MIKITATERGVLGQNYLLLALKKGVLRSRLRLYPMNLEQVMLFREFKMYQSNIVKM